ncbi:hypothetical protein F4778DRAFT_259378 [Xylariomycetidae sp. FL2044]|nr:hypothetical protein F4778DRAFT_259378 [Xylariomycetidae sp. FL2044]
MSASRDAQPDRAADITCIAEPFEPRPLIADILRTRYCVPKSIFLVEGVDWAHTSRSKRWRMVRLLLGDGELCIQAILAAELHPLVDQGDIVFGSYVELGAFRLEWQDATDDKLGKEIAENKDDEQPDNEQHDNDTSRAKKGIFYLIVNDMSLVGWHNALVQPTENAIAVESAEDSESVSDTGELPREEEPAGPSNRQEGTKNHVSGRSSMVNDGSGPHPYRGSGLDIGDITREQESVNRFDQKESTKPLASALSPIINDGFDTPSIPTTTQDRNDRPGAAPQANAPLVPEHESLPRPSKDLTKPLKLTKLRSIPLLPYKQNWSVNTLAVVSALSDVEPSGLPPYTQRQARLADPSTDKHVLLTVFLDPAEFAPAVGSVVLLLGVKNHRFDGGSLKKYASDRPKDGAGWWFENPAGLDWCDVAGLREWWAEQGVVD